ncbi:MAG: ATP-binding protein [Peptococcaceae bacterium]|nr:ATP-binding protein [Peptococcaceae bacterium]
MIAKVYACALLGLEALPVEVEAGIYGGLPDLILVGLPDAVIRESRERVRSAVVNAGYKWPGRRTLINLAPAHLRKEGSGFDLAVAVALLKAAGQLPALDTSGLLFLGELSLNGSLRGTKGVLAVALAMERWPDKILVVPEENRLEALQGTSRVMVLTGLAQLRDEGYMRRSMAAAESGELAEGGAQAAGAEGAGVVSGAGAGRAAGAAASAAPAPGSDAGSRGAAAGGQRPAAEYAWDLSLVKGQLQARRALELAAAGQHNLLLVGPPGSGKSLLARCLPSILPPPCRDETLAINRIYSVAGLLSPERPWISQRPFRSPHSGISQAGLLGGGWPVRPGEISLAHNGVLYLDELPELDRSCLESLRQPLEEGQITISRVWGSVTLPARIQLVASANPCPCGYYGDGRTPCRCSDYELRRYQNRLSGPLLDRMDMIVSVPRLKGENLSDGQAESEGSAAVAARVARAWEIRRARGQAAPLALAELRRQMTKAAGKFAIACYEEENLTARGYYRMLLLGRTIADLAGADSIDDACLAEALQYRQAFAR